MTLNEQPDRLAWLVPLVLVGAAPAFGVLLGLSQGPTALYEWTENLGLIFVPLFAVLALRVSAKTPGSRFPGWLLTAALASVALMVTSAFTIATSPGLALLGSYQLVTGLAAGVAAYRLAERGQAVFLSFLWAIFLGGLVLVPMPMLIEWLGSPPSGTKWTYAIPGFGNIRRFDHIATLATICGLGLIVLRSARRETPRQRSITLLIALGAALILAAEFWGGARSAAVAMAIAIPTGLVVGRVPLRTTSIVAVVGASAAALSLVLPRPTGSFGLLSRAAADVGQRLPKGMDISSGRSTIWTWIVETIAQNPLTGIGYNQLGAVARKEVGFYHAHNAILEVLLGYGLIAGTLLLLLIGGFVLAGLLRCLRKREPMQVAGAMLALSMAIYGMFCATLYYPIPLMGFSVGVAMMLVDTRGLSPECCNSGGSRR